MRPANEESEQELEPQLELPRQPSRRGLAEIAAPKTGGVAVELSVIEEVVELEPELQRSPFLAPWEWDAGEVLVHRQIEVIDALPAHDVTSFGPEFARWVRSEGSGIEPLSLGVDAGARIGVANKIGPVSAAAAMGNIARLRADCEW